MNQPVTYAHSDIADKRYPVAGARISKEFRDGSVIDPVEVEVGGPDLWGKKITRIEFYTGFAGCPPRYFITTVDPTASGGERTTIHPA